MRKYKRFGLKKFPVFSQGCLGFQQQEVKGQTKISMEAKNPRVLEEKLISVEKSLTDIKQRMRKCKNFGLKLTSRFQARMPWLSGGLQQEEAKG